MPIFVAHVNDPTQLVTPAPTPPHCHPPTTHQKLPASGGILNRVYIGQFNVVTQADVYVPTACGPTPHAPVVLPIPNATVFAGNLPIAKANDPLSCGDVVGAGGAFNVYVY